jgi:ATP-dependent Clp protease ATP-binding subunit ClpC
MKRAIARLLEAPLAEKVLRGELSRGDLLLVASEQGELTFDVLEAENQLTDSAAE